MRTGNSPSKNDTCPGVTGPKTSIPVTPTRPRTDHARSKATSPIRRLESDHGVVGCWWGE
uniref:Uncharacterized protein n=1 Tax=Arundo donax TaxID=35708 RepID=A0A0A9FJJ4_ARUDO